MATIATTITAPGLHPPSSSTATHQSTTLKDPTTPPPPTTEQSISLKVIFTGGLAPTFAPPPLDTHDIALPYTTAHPPTAGSLVQHLTSTLLRDASPSALATFVLARGDNTPRPGILVLVNDADWELEGGPECPLVQGDEVLFVSTLHGG